MSDVENVEQVDCELDGKVYECEVYTEHPSQASPEMEVDVEEVFLPEAPQGATVRATVPSSRKESLGIIADGEVTCSHDTGHDEQSTHRLVCHPWD